MIYISVFLFNTSVTFPCKKGQTLLDVKKHFLLKSIHKSSGEKHLKIQYTNGFKDNLYVKPFNIDLSIILLKMQLECFVLCLTLITPLTHSLKQSWCQKLLCCLIQIHHKGLVNFGECKFIYLSISNFSQS